MLIYGQKLGLLTKASGLFVGSGYSGYQEGKNNPELESVHDVGPIPKGDYSIGEPFDSAEHGPFCLRLTPLAGTNTFGRDGFLIHGDSIKHPGEASRGCIILPHAVRETIRASKDKLLRVVE